jgi:hypothetical protein
MNFLKQFERDVEIGWLLLLRSSRIRGAGAIFLY